MTEMASLHTKDTTDQDFMADVVEASEQQPVIVDFWAPWCGPCRTLGPIIEKAVESRNGQVKLVKINIDENPAYAGQLGVRSIPAVYAFDKGRPVDAFMGALPESQINAFVEKLLSGTDAGKMIAEALEQRRRSMRLSFSRSQKTSQRSPGSLAVTSPMATRNAPQ